MRKLKLPIIFEKICPFRPSLRFARKRNFLGTLRIGQRNHPHSKSDVAEEFK